MDILNFISWIASKRRVVTSVPDDALVPVGIRTEPRDDKYTTVAIKKSDLITGGGNQLQIKVNNSLITGPQTELLNIVGSNIGGSQLNPTESQLFITTGVGVNGQYVQNIQIGPSSLVTVTNPNPYLSLITLKPEIPYKAYRAKLTAGEIDWPGYGYLYNWYAVDDARGLANPDGGTGLTAPNEWRVPSDTDWDTLLTFAGGSSVAGGKLKSTLNSDTPPFYGWLNNGGGTDDYNFGGLPSGSRFKLGNFEYIGLFQGLWTNTPNDSSTSKAIFLDYRDTVVDTFLENKGYGQAVRLVREATAGELLLNDGDTSDTSSLDPYTGNDGTVYVTVKIDTQIWLAQNLRETLYNNSDPILNGSILPGGSPSNSTWEGWGNTEQGAWTAYLYGSGNQVQYLPETIGTIYTEVLENSLGATVNWLSKLDGTNVYYEAKLATARPWYPTHIKLTPGYDVSDYDNSIPTLIQKNLIVKRAVTGEINIEFFPVTIDSTGALTIEPLNNYSDLLGSPDSSVYVEILEYQPESYYYSSSLAEGIGVSNL
jgi:uncharacterized protein (TIGR02145 family)